MASLDILYEPIQVVIDLFKHQRKRGLQFAVVFLSPYPLHLISTSNLMFLTIDMVLLLKPRIQPSLRFLKNMIVTILSLQDLQTRVNVTQKSY